MYLLRVRYKIDINAFDEEIYEETVIAEYRVMLEDYLNTLEIVNNATVISYFIEQIEYKKCYIISKERK